MQRERAGEGEGEKRKEGRDERTFLEFSQRKYYMVSFSSLSSYLQRINPLQKIVFHKMYGQRRSTSLILA